jgi:electron transfer flavoprotein beta subunit
MALREALAMGCDDAVLISGREFSGSDTYATAYTLGAGVRTLGFDLVLTGRQAIDGDTAQVGPQLAEQLHIPQVSYAEEITLGEDDSIIVKRKTDDGSQLIRVKQPCLITVLSESVVPRYMTVHGTVDAFTKDIRVMSFDDLKDSLNPDWIGLNGSPTKVVKTYVKSGKSSGEKMTNLTPDEAVSIILEKLCEIHLI